MLYNDQDLYAAIVLRAIEDALYYKQKTDILKDFRAKNLSGWRNVTPHDCIQARAWLTSDSTWLVSCLEMANCEPSRAKKAFREWRDSDWLAADLEVLRGMWGPKRGGIKNPNGAAYEGF